MAGNSTKGLMQPPGEHFIWKRLLVKLEEFFPYRWGFETWVLNLTLHLVAV